MAISDDLFRAILAMDAYNRGYNAGIGDPVTGLAGTQIGNATINSNLNTTGWQAASFFAQSYTWAGKTVISYRGTDVLPWLLGGDDPWIRSRAGHDVARTPHLDPRPHPFYVHCGAGLIVSREGS